MSRNPLCIAILWHMHQPEYGNVETGEVYLPRTRFHAAKDYYDMAFLAASEPGMRLTINVVPSLVDQLEAYGRLEARETYAALALRDAAELDERERAFLLRHFFQLPWGSMVHPYPRYRQLLALRGEPDAHGEFRAGLRRYGEEDFRDLQTWFNLSWCGDELRRRPDIARLFEQGTGFSEADKRLLIETQLRFCGEIVPLYRGLLEQGRLEIAVSPYYHPILPLLCDSRAAREQAPGVPLPPQPFGYPADAREQIRRARARFVEAFGRAPAGMWPSEGSVSDAAVLLAAEGGFRWLASDDAVLYHSLRKSGALGGHLTPERKFRAYRLGPEGPCLLFRDHGLSDLIGFTYSKWDPGDAAADLLQRLRDIQLALPEDGRHYVVPNILDGENAWEHYPDNGASFLSRLYHGLATSPHLRPVTFSEYLELEPQVETLDSLAAGSWIGANFTTWIGHPEKNRGWEHLAAARAFLAARAGSDPGAPPFDAAYREMLIAEGSDWFWWYGDDHQTENAAEFDALFRSHVKNVYRKLGADYPPELDTPIKPLPNRFGLRGPARTLTPRVDGRVSDYFEWLAAGVALAGGGGSMHRAERTLDSVHFGYDAAKLYVRVDAGVPIATLPEDAVIVVHFLSPRDRKVRIDRSAAGEWRTTWTDATVTAPPESAVDRIVELGVPLADLGLAPPGEARFYVSYFRADRELERFPPSEFLTVLVDPAGIDQAEWLV
jgi:alpha-amylase/alpha-mannosidase (GH57 family)